MNGVVVLTDGLKRLNALVKLLRTNRKHDKAAALASRLSFLQAQEARGSMARRVWPNSKVTVKNLNSGEMYTYRLVYPNEADGARGSISLLSPLGMALIGREEGEYFSFESPGGLMNMIMLELHEA